MLACNSIRDDDRSPRVLAADGTASRKAIQVRLTCADSAQAETLRRRSCHHAQTLHEAAAHSSEHSPLPAVHESFLSKRPGGCATPRVATSSRHTENITTTTTASHLFCSRRDSAASTPSSGVCSHHIHRPSYKHPGYVVAAIALPPSASPHSPADTCSGPTPSGIYPSPLSTSNDHRH